MAQKQKPSNSSAPSQSSQAASDDLAGLDVLADVIDVQGNDDQFDGNTDGDAMVVDDSQADPVSDDDDGQSSANTNSNPSTARNFLSEFERKTGRRFEQYSSDEDFINALDNLYYRVGVKDTDAEFGRHVREAVRGREREFEDFLRSNAVGTSRTPQPQTAKTDDQDFEFDPDWRHMIITGEDGTLRPAPGAPPDIVEKYQRGQRILAAKMAEFVKDPAGFIEKYAPSVIEKAKLEAIAEAQAKAAQVSEEVEIQRWREKNAAKLYIGGDPANGVTPYGRALAEAYDELGRNGTFASTLAQLRMAERMVAPLFKTETKTTAVKPAARRVPEVVNPAKSTEPAKSPVDRAVEMIEKEGKDYAEVMEWLAKANAAAKK